MKFVSLKKYVFCRDCRGKLLLLHQIFYEVKKVFILFLFLSPVLAALGQTIEVVDAKTGRPVEGILLISAKQTAQTDGQGKASLDDFDGSEAILFQHSSFLKHTTTKQKIAEQGNKVFLVENPVRLDEIVISVNRWEQSKAEVSNRIISVSAAEVGRYQPQTTADLVGSGGGVFVQKSQMGGGSPMIRGFSANRLLLVVDGIRMNNAIYRSGNLHNIISLDAQMIENTEIIFGPGSVIYGSDALGGVMSFNTFRAKLSTGTGVEPSGKVMTRFSGANLEKTIHGTINFGAKKWAALVGSTFTGFGDLRMGSNGPDEYLRPEYVLKGGFQETDIIQENDNPKIQKYTGYNQFNILGKVRYRPDERLEITAGAIHSQTSDIPRYDRLIVYKNNQFRYGDWYYGPQKWSLFSAQVQYHSDLFLFDKLNFLSGFQRYTESRFDRNLHKPVRNGREEDLSVFSVNLDLAKSINAQNEFFYGIESYLNTVNSTGTATQLVTGETEVIPSRYPGDSDYGSVAAYFSYKFNLANRLILQAGIRGTRTWLSGEFNPEHYHFPFAGFDMKNSALNGNIGLVWHPTTEWQVNLSSSTGFRSPNLDDVAKVFDSEPGNVMVPNPGLKPEYARNFEIGIIRSFSGKAVFEVNGFYTRLKDAMVRRDFTLNGQDSLMYDGTMSKVEALVNADAADIYGGSLVLEYWITDFIRTRHDATITCGADSDGFPLRHAPPLFGRSHLIFENQRWFADLYADFSGRLTFDNLAPSEQEKPYLYATDRNGNPYSPGWWTLNLKMTYPVLPALTLSGGVENILDKRYRTYSSGIAAPGINFVVSATACF